MELFQTWKVLHPIPSILDDAALTWTQKNPYLRRRLFDDHFIIEYFRDRKEACGWCLDNERPFIRTVDLFRYAYLFDNGGLYADLDFVCLHPIFSVLESYENAVVLGSANMLDYHLDNSVPNAIMYSGSKRHPFWATILSMAESRRTERFVEVATGPVVLKDALTLYNSFSDYNELLNHPLIRQFASRIELHGVGELPPVVVLPPRYFYPISWGIDDDRKFQLPFRRAKRLEPRLWSEMETSDDTYAFTFWYHSWSGGSGHAAGRSAEDLAELGLPTE